MKNLNILGVHRKIQLLEGFTKKIYIYKGNCIKREPWTVCRFFLRGGALTRGVWCFWRGLILFEDCGNIVFSCIEMGIVNIDLNNINLDNLMKMILILLFISDFGLGILNLKNTNLLKKDKWRINANSMASLKMVKFLHVRRWEKRNRNNFHCVMLLVYTIWEYWNFLPLQTFVNV